METSSGFFGNHLGANLTSLCSFSRCRLILSCVLYCEANYLILLSDYLVWEAIYLYFLSNYLFFFSNYLFWEAFYLYFLSNYLIVFLNYLFWEANYSV